ncbi:MAG: histidine phosphatase family protein [Rhodospirillaceae bacterium]|jgi:probable phosphoglycerate mutase|nr:histidine phosphatase family protein [Rhodospirillaceae bacterium]
MEIIFARHGNTFNPSDKVVWIGRETDLPLVKSGMEQALVVADTLRRISLVPDVIYTASLIRTRRFAQIISQALELISPIIDSRLDELDYGKWAGRSNDEIIYDGGKRAEDAINSWNVTDVWPKDSIWGSQQTDIKNDIDDFVIEHLTRHQRPLVISSNGILRFLPRAILPPSMQQDSFKMHTGHLGIIDSEDNKVCLRFWNVDPKDLH